MYQLKPRFWDDSEICLLFSRKQHKQYLFHVVDDIIFEHIRSPQGSCLPATQCYSLPKLYTEFLIPY